MSASGPANSPFPSDRGPNSCGTTSAVAEGMRKLAFHLLIALVAVGGVAAVADALVVTDEERLETFAEDLSGDILPERIDAALGYFDPDRQPVEVVTDGQRLFFAEGEGADLAAEVRAVLAPHGQQEATLLQRAIELRDDDARVALRLRTSEDVVDATFDLRKHGERWFVRRVRVR